MLRKSRKLALTLDDVKFVRSAIEEGVWLLIAVSPCEYATTWNLRNMAPAALANALMKAEARGMEKARTKDSWVKWLLIAGFASMMLAIAFFIIVKAVENKTPVLGI